MDRIRSEISRLVAMSSRLDDVARSICSSNAEAPEVNQPAIVVLVVRRVRGRLVGCQIVPGKAPTDDLKKLRGLAWISQS